MIAYRACLVRLDASARGAFDGPRCPVDVSEGGRLLELQPGLRVSSGVHMCVRSCAPKWRGRNIALVHCTVNPHSLDAFFGRGAWRAQRIVGVPAVG